MLRLHNTLTRQKEPFLPGEPPLVRMYTCGPTVYRFVHIGNLRSYLMADWLRRALRHQGYRVRHVKNITDVGHMRQDMLERGEDKMIAAALREGKTPQQIAAFYTEAFWRDEQRLNILPAHVFPRATDHIPEMVAIIERLLANGYAYEVGGNVYFDVSRFPEYGKLSGNELGPLLEGVRVEADPLKRHQSDFALWKAAEPGRMLRWPSPWGDGFPGWHIECSAMAWRHLGERLDLHTGGVDNIFPHHEDEIAQSEGAFGPPFVRHWVHGQHLLADGLKMAKSTGNSYTLDDLAARGFDPMAFRYLCCTAHYRSRLNFTFTALRGAQQALERLRARLREWVAAAGASPEALLALARQRALYLHDPSETEIAPPMGFDRTLGLAGEVAAAVEGYRARFWAEVADDLNLPRALALVWELASSALPPAARLALVLEFDDLLGLRLAESLAANRPPARVLQVVEEREAARARRDFATADRLRADLASAGWSVRDTPQGPLVEAIAAAPATAGAVSSAREVRSLLSEPDQCEFSINLLVSDYLADAQRCVESLLRWRAGHDLELVVVDNGSAPATAAWLEELAGREPCVRLLRADHVLGEAEGRNLGLKQSLGRYVLLLDTSIEFVGDALTPLAEALADPAVGAAGGWGLRSGDLRHFEASQDREVDAVEGYCLAFRRAVLNQVGLLDEKFRFYRNLDLDFSMALRARGYRLLRLDLPLRQHEHRGWTSLSPEERDQKSKRNFYRFLAKWGDRTDLLIARYSHHHHSAEG